MGNFWDSIKRVFREADIILEVLDARFVEETRNVEIEQKVRYNHKKLIYVLNKCDLVEDMKTLREWKKKLSPCVFVSATDHLGTRILKETIIKTADAKKNKIVVGVLGYPNTGKSSLINALGGHGKAGTSPRSGHTKGTQYVRISQRIKLIDAPGVFSHREKKGEQHTMIGAVDFNKTDDPEYAFYSIYEKYPALILTYYQVESDDDPDAILEQIAEKNNLYLKGKTPDTQRAARMVIQDWQTGKIHKGKEEKKTE